MTLVEYEKLSKKEKKNTNKKYASFGGFKNMMSIKYKEDDFSCGLSGIVAKKWNHLVIKLFRKWWGVRDDTRRGTQNEKARF